MNLNKNSIFPITPLLILLLISVCTLIYSIIRSIYEPSIGLGTGLTMMLSMFLLGLYLIEKKLLKRISLIKLIPAEIILLFLTIFSYKYFNSELNLFIETDNDYIVLYSTKKGINIDDFTTNYLFDKELFLNTNDDIFISKELYNNKKFRIKLPEAWSNGHRQKMDYILISSDTVLVKIIGHNISTEIIDSILKTKIKELKTTYSTVYSK